MNDTAPSLATTAPAPPGTGPLARLLAEIGARSGIPFRIVWTDGSAYSNSDAAPAVTSDCTRILLLPDATVYDM